MTSKDQLLTTLQVEFRRWDERVARLSEAQAGAQSLPGDLSLKDQLAHLMAWQQVSIARFEAARQGRAPIFPAWLAGADPEADDAIDQINARIAQTYQGWSWPEIYQAWRAGFQRFLELGEGFTEQDLFAAGRYTWLNGYALADVLKGSYGHHQEHFAELPASLGE